MIIDIRIRGRDCEKNKTNIGWVARKKLTNSDFSPVRKGQAWVYFHIDVHNCRSWKIVDAAVYKKHSLGIFMYMGSDMIGFIIHKPKNNRS
jgi:hypothetical protein